MTQPPLSREEIAKREIGRTEIAPALAWLMTVLFLVTLALPATVQLIAEARGGSAAQTPSSLQLIHSFPAVADAFSSADRNLWDRTLAANRALLRHIEEYEKQLEERSLLTRHLLGPTQHWLTAIAGLGNEKAYVGREGWLFYRPDVDYLTAPGFLDPEVLRRRSAAGKQHLNPPQPDPRPAILEFHQHLARRGIRLVIMPMPGKSAIRPDMLSPRSDRSDGALENDSFRQFCDEMEAAGVLVFDAAPFMADVPGAPPTDETGWFLRTDTHWTPGAVEVVARELKRFLERNCPPGDAPDVEFSEHSREIANLGDIAVMLHLPEDQALFPPERVTIREVMAPDGQAWEPDETAEVLLLGDSYTNIFSLSEMNWGAAAGLAERLSFALGRSVDRVAQNDGGSHAVRQALHQQLARGHDRLKGKRVVIWEFAVRELAFGDWKMFPMPERPLDEDKSPADAPSPSAGAALVRATVRVAAGAPQPGSVPYRDAVTGVHMDSVEGLEGTFPDSEIVVYLWGLRDDRLQKAAKFAPNQKVTLRLVPWESVRAKYERFNRIELDDPDFRLAELPIYWAEEAP
jgi:alginate O-acetyltransferase complex protein AlgJ